MHTACRMLIVGVIYGISLPVFALCELEKDTVLTAATAAREAKHAAHQQEKKRLQEKYRNARVGPTQQEREKERRLALAASMADKALHEARVHARPCFALGFREGAHNTAATPPYRGTGKETQGADDLLTYPGMSGPQWGYELFGRSTHLRIRYSERADLRTFRATLNGEDVSERFTAGRMKKLKPDWLEQELILDGTEQVSLPFKQGKNVLLLKIAEQEDATLGHAPYWDEDVFHITATTRAQVFIAEDPPASGSGSR